MARIIRSVPGRHSSLVKGLFAGSILALLAVLAVSGPSEAVTLLPGDILIADVSGAVIRVNPADGTQTVVSSGGHFVEPFSIAIMPNGDLLVADRTCCGGQGGIIRVNPADGTQTVVSSGDNFRNPVGIALVDRRTVVVADRECCGGLGGVIRVDLADGAQTLLSSGDNFIDPLGIAIAPNRRPAGGRPRLLWRRAGWSDQGESDRRQPDRGVVREALRQSLWHRNHRG